MTIRTIPILIVVCMQFSLVAFEEGQIAFIKNDHVFIASADGEDIRRIDNDPRAKQNLRWDASFARNNESIAWGWMASGDRVVVGGVDDALQIDSGTGQVTPLSPQIAEEISRKKDAHRRTIAKTAAIERLLKQVGGQDGTVLQ